MTNIMLVRHGQTVWSLPPRFRGHADLPLSKAGVDQAQAVRERIRASCKPAAIYTSPLRRCVATAQIISEPFGLALKPNGGLIDIDYGQWQGLTLEEAKARWPEEFEAWIRFPHRARIPGGETLQEVNARACAASRQILRDHPRETVIVVAHSCIIRAMLLNAMEMPLSRYRCLAQNLGAISELAFHRGRFLVKAINETYHLKPEPRA